MGNEIRTGELGTNSEQQFRSCALSKLVKNRIDNRQIISFIRYYVPNV